MARYAAYAERHAADGAEGRLVSMYKFNESWTSWERHPSGDEVVIWSTRPYARLKSRLRTPGRIDDPAVAAYDGTRRQACLVDMCFPKDVHHTLAFAEQVIGDDAPMAAPPDGLGAHDHAPVPVAEPAQSRKAGGEGLRQGIVGIVPEAAYPPIGVRGQLGAARLRAMLAARLRAMAAKFRDMPIADLPRRQRFGEAFTVELRIGARPRHRSHVDDEIDARFPEQIAEFADRSGGMTYGEENVRVGSDGTMAPGRRDPDQRGFMTETALVLPNISGA